ncbi:MAG: radical SAM/Cys-rich domain protein [Coriobacteriia bacterium]|nr:radical SAM/Cys-rich domain protein [Coriobacteriia bacterium]
MALSVHNEENAPVAPVQPFLDRVAELSRPELLTAAETPSTLQVNVGARCNLQCRHCHIQAGPDREEMMSREVMEACLQVFADNGFSVLDVTGGAPELHADYRWFITEGTRLALAAGNNADIKGTVLFSPFQRQNRTVPFMSATGNKGRQGGSSSAPLLGQPEKGGKTITRTNLVILTEDGFGDLPAFWAELGVEVAFSLPSWEERNTDRQRGEGTFRRAIEGLRLLNAAGYGLGKTNTSGRPLVANLVVNPGGAFLPPAQTSAEREYRQHLKEEHGVCFDSLLTITNNPLGRFGDLLEERGIYNAYMKRLSDAFNPATVENMMCRSQISVAWDGRLFDCDFNQVLNWPFEEQPTIFSVAEQGIKPRQMRLGDHCYACCAGAGSSCGGATA